jgi:ketosteroid isomerase-like protein
MSAQALQAAEALTAAIGARSSAQVAAIYADDIEVWHASTRTSATKAQNVALLDGVFQLTSELRYVNIRRHLIDGGIVQQHQLVGKFNDGKVLPVLEACLVIKVRDGKITEIEEYFDGQTFAEVWSRLAALMSSPEQ